MNAALGGVSAGGAGTPLFEVTHSGGGPSALVANQSVGNAGGVTPSKFSLNVTRPEHGGHGLPPESCTAAGATATPAMSTAKQTRLLKVVCLELDWTLQSISASIEPVCQKTLQSVNQRFQSNPPTLKIP
jgi:hypothetical protein